MRGVESCCEGCGGAVVRVGRGCCEGCGGAVVRVLVCVCMCGIFIICHCRFTQKRQ